MSMLERFRHEVMGRGADACLPRNLPDEWLRIVASGADLLNMERDLSVPPEDQPDERKTIALAGVATLLWAKASGEPVQVSLSQLADYMRLFRLELTLEALHRSTALRYEPASVESILTDRDIATSWNDHSGSGPERGHDDATQVPASVVRPWEDVPS
jgi:hypothetical protein